MRGSKYVSIEIGRIGNLLKRDFSDNPVRQQLEEATGKNGWIIGFLAEHSDEDIFQKDIEARFSMRRSTVSNMIALMEKKGYITRLSVSSDARLKKLVLTQKALDAYQLMLSQLNKQEELLKKDISEDELKTFFEVLDKIRHNIGEDDSAMITR